MKGGGGGLTKPMCITQGQFHHLPLEFLPNQFSIYFEKKTLWWVWRENTQVRASFSPLMILGQISHVITHHTNKSMVQYFAFDNPIHQDN